jgi:hypothetical protein
LWGPVLAWSALEVLAESFGGVDAMEAGQAPLPPNTGRSGAPEQRRTALDLFDRLRLREPLAHAFQSLGFAGEEHWRAAARIKVALLIEAGSFELAESESESKSELMSRSTAPLEHPLPIHSPAFWQDADVRWLTGVHDTEGQTYFNQGSFEELLWWLQLPTLCRLAAEPGVPGKPAIGLPGREPVPSSGAMLRVSRAVARASEAAALAGYRVAALTSGGSAHESEDEMEDGNRSKREGKQLQR